MAARNHPPQHESWHCPWRLPARQYDLPTRRTQVLAVLDWELSTLGDPIADFSYLMLNWHNPPDGRAGLAGLDLKALGIPSRTKQWTAM